MYAYEDDFDRKSRNLDADEYTPEEMYKYFLDMVDNYDSVDELINDYNWREFTSELGLR